MTKKIEEPLIDLIKALRGVPKKMTAEVSKVTAMLNHKETDIPNNTQGKNLACLIIAIIFSSIPELRNNENKTLLERFAKKIGLTPIHTSEENKKSTPRRK